MHENASSIRADTQLRTHVMSSSHHHIIISRARHDNDATSSPATRHTSRRVSRAHSPTNPSRTVPRTCAMVSTPHCQSTAQRAHRAGVDVMSLVAMSVLILAPSAAAARTLYADTDANATHAPWSAAYATMTHAPRDVATVISRVDDAFERCRSRELLSRALDACANASGSDAARDAADVYTVATDWCNFDFLILEF